MNLQRILSDLREWARHNPGTAMVLVALLALAFVLIYAVGKPWGWFSDSPYRSEGRYQLRK